MPVAQRAAAASSTANPTTTQAITIPATVQANDVLFIHVTSRDHITAQADYTVTDNDTGGNPWALMSTSPTDERSRVWWKRATSGTAGKVVTIATTVGSAAAGLAAFSGAITTGDPFADVTVETNASADETHAGATNALPSQMFCIAIANYANDNAVTAVSGATAGAFTQCYEKLSTGGNDCGSTIWRVQTSGNTGNITWAQADGTTYSHLWRIVEEPAAAFTPNTRVRDYQGILAQ